jgi:N-acetylglucosaminyldiphosphoundecaprenol N-acetyl-beta-D-mannosaminyltransferase
MVERKPELEKLVLPTVRLAGVQLHAITEAQCVGHVLNESTAGRGGWVVTANLDHLRRLVYEGSYSQLCSSASLVVADGMPLVLASRIQGTPLPERVAGSSMILTLSAAAAGADRSIYLLGGTPGTETAAADVLKQRYPRLRIAGTSCPRIGFDQDQEQVDRIGEELTAAQPDIVYVALGSPKQEWLIHTLRDRLPGAWWMGVGISFSFVCGDVRRAPVWMQRSGLEWIHRLAQEPRRLAKRYLIDGCPFAARLLAGAALQRFEVARP